MQAWATDVLATATKGRDLRIRPAAAYAILRRHMCFADASDRTIRSAVWRSAAKVDLSVKRPDVGKYNLWPPSTRYDLNNRMLRLFENRPEIAGGEDEFDVGDFEYVRFAVGPDGLPDREEWVSEFWNRIQENRAKEGRPLAPYAWPKLRIRLLTESRVGKAAELLPFKCPLCHARRISPGGFINGHWVVVKDQLHCFECSRVLNQLREVRSAREQSAARNELFLRGMAAIPPVKNHRPLKSKRVDERAILRAVYEMGLIKEGDRL